MNSYYVGTNQPSHLQRNKTERRRLQGLQLVLTPSLESKEPAHKKLHEKWDVWMINEGGRQLFFAVWIFLHLLVAAFGAVNYQFKDNLVNARATFGVTYSALCLFFVFCNFEPFLLQLLLALPLWCFMSTSYSSSFLSAGTLSLYYARPRSTTSSRLTRASPSTRQRDGQ